jgi:hypothetical protein
MDQVPDIVVIEVIRENIQGVPLEVTMTDLVRKCVTHLVLLPCPAMQTGEILPVKLDNCMN